jgi:hypothetical protein
MPRLASGGVLVLCVAALILLPLPACAQAADGVSITPEMVARLHRTESRLPGTTLYCYQGGQEVLYEPGLRDFAMDADGVTGLRPDGSRVRIQALAGGAALCKAVSRAGPAGGQ